jgi:putative SOS response-associated peptidase YedK
MRTPKWRRSIPKAMPALLRTAEEIDRWLAAPVEDALELQRPLPDGTLEIVAVGQRQDGSGSPVLE